MSTERFMFDSHMHTPLCKHAEGEPEEYAAAGFRANLRGIIMTCHNPLPGRISSSVRMCEHQWPTYLELVERAREAWQGRLDVRLGLECDYIPGMNLESHLARQAESEAFDYLLGSVHPHVREYQSLHWFGDPVAFQRTYFDHLAMTAELGLFDCLAHPDLVKNIAPDAWNLPRILSDIRRSLDRIASADVALELNTSGWYKSVPEQNPALIILREAARRGIAVVLGSDAHCPDRVAHRFCEAMDMLSEAGYSKVSYFLQRERVDVRIDQAQASLEVLNAEQ